VYIFAHQKAMSVHFIHYWFCQICAQHYCRWWKSTSL